jgi:hypothetical protein
VVAATAVETPSPPPALSEKAAQGTAAAPAASSSARIVTAEEGTAHPTPVPKTVVSAPAPAEAAAVPTTPAPDAQQRISELIAQARRQLDHRRFSQPPGNNAFETYPEILRVDPGHAEAKAGIHALSVCYAHWAELAERRRQWENAQMIACHRYLYPYRPKPVMLSRRDRRSLRTAAEHASESRACPCSV